MTQLFDSLAAIITGTFVAFAVLLFAPVLARVPVRRELRRLRLRVFPSNLD